MAEVINSVPVVTPAVQDDLQLSKVDKDTKEGEESNIYSYIFIAILSVVLILLLYYAYNRFVTNSVKDPFTKGNQQERDDPVVDFNLREVIEELRHTQGLILKTLSENN